LRIRNLQVFAILRMDFLHTLEYTVCALVVDKRMFFVDIHFVDNQHHLRLTEINEKFTKGYLQLSEI
jgi:hypothetical protein